MSEVAAAGEVTLVALLRRKPGMSVDEFRTYWAEVHAPLVLSTQSGGYVQRYERRLVVGDTDYDGVTIQTYASYEDFVASMAAADFQTIADDLPKFLDVNAIAWVVTGAPMVER